MQRPSRQQWARRGQQPTQPPVRRRRISRAEREARRQRQLYIGVGIAGALIVLVLAVGAVNEYFVKPRQVLATVNGVNIRRQDYWKFRGHELVQQISQYQQLAQVYGGEQGQQYLSFAQAAQQQLDEVWGSTDVDDATLEMMIEDQIHLQYADGLGVAVTDQEVDTWILQQFEPGDAPLVAPTPSPTLIPTRAAWATETAVAGATQTAEAQVTATAEAAAMATAQAAASPVGEGNASPEASPVTSAVGTAATDDTGSATGSPTAATTDASPQPDAASPVASPAGSPAVEGSPAASPTIAPTPNPEEALSTAETGYAQFQDAVFDVTRMSEADYRRLIARPSVTRERVEAALAGQVGQTAEQVRAAHILVDTADLARSIRDQLDQPGANFEDLARLNSTDTGTAPNGGDLGWFTRNMMVDPFAEVAFALQPGQISEPFETEFGWHIVKVYEHAADRPMTDEQIEAERQAVIDDWLAARKREAEVESEIDPTATPVPGSESFVPPPDAPPTPTTAPAASPAASPVGSSAADASPGAAAPVLAATPAGSADASPPA